MSADNRIHDDPHYGGEPIPERRNFFGIIFAIIGSVLFACQSGTQFLAWSWNFHERLGQPLFSLGTGAHVTLGLAALCIAGFGVGMAFEEYRRHAPLFFLSGTCLFLLWLGPLYSPIRVFYWIEASSGVAGYEWVFEQTSYAMMAGLAVGLFSTLPIAVGGFEKPTGSHGTARWYDGEDFKGKNGGFVIGRKDGKLLRYTDDGHLLTVAPTRSGKGVGCVMPNLLDYEGSVLVTDPKGENYEVSSHWRGREETVTWPEPSMEDIRERRKGKSDRRTEKSIQRAKKGDRSETIRGDEGCSQRVLALDPFEAVAPIRPDLPEEGASEAKKREYLKDLSEYRKRRAIYESDKATYNPLDLIDMDSDNAGDDAMMLADMLVVHSGDGGDKHWEDEAKNLLSGIILYVCQTEKKSSKLRSLPYVRHLVTLGKEEEDDREAQLRGARTGEAEEPTFALDALEDAAPRETFSEDENTHIDGINNATGRPQTRDALISDMMLRGKVAGGRIQRSANQFRQKAGKEKSGVLSFARSATEFIDSERMEQSMSKSSFDMRALKGAPTSLFLILPAELLKTYKNWLRLVIACGITIMTRAKGQPEKRVLFLLDEFANLGRMEPVQTAMSLLAGYGVSLWIFLQDLSQLKSTYEDRWESFIGNSDVLQAFGNSDHFTAEHIQKMAGKTTIQTKNQSRSVQKNPLTEKRGSDSDSIRETGRNLLNADEIRRLHETREILIVRGYNPINAEKVRYYEQEPFMSRKAPRNLMGQTFTWDEEKDERHLRETEAEEDEDGEEDPRENDRAQGQGAPRDTFGDLEKNVRNEGPPRPGGDGEAAGDGFGGKAFPREAPREEGRLGTAPAFGAERENGGSSSSSGGGSSRGERPFDAFAESEGEAVENLDEEVFGPSSAREGGPGKGRPPASFNEGSGPAAPEAPAGPFGEEPARREEPPSRQGFPLEEQPAEAAALAPNETPDYLGPEDSKNGRGKSSNGRATGQKEKPDFSDTSDEEFFTRLFRLEKMLD